MKLQEQSNSTLIEMLKNRSLDSRDRVVKILGKRKAIEAILPLIESIDDEAIQDDIVDAIRSMQDVAMNSLIHLLKNPNSHIRKNSAFTLGQIRSREAIQPLITLLTDSSEEVHVSAYTALGQIGEIAVDNLMSEIHDPNPKVRIGIAYALGIINQSNSNVPKITLKIDPNEILKNISIEELLGHTGESGDDDDEADEPDDENFDTSHEYAVADFGVLSKEKSDRVVSDLIELLKYDENDEVKEAASFSLAGMGEFSADLLIQEIISPNSKILNAAIYTLGQNLITHQISSAIPPLIVKLRDEDPEIRYLAVKALRYAKEPQTVQPLIALLQDPYEEIRYEAVEGLQRRNDPSILDALITALKDDSSQVRRIAACGLGNLADIRAKPALMQILNDEDREVRKIAASALGKLKSESITDVYTLLKSNDPKLRSGALLTLGEGKDNKSLPMILPALRDIDPDVRRAAAEALCNFSNPEVIPDLLNAFNDRNAQVRKFVLRALSKIEDPNILASMIAGLKDTNSTVRQEAVWHLADIGGEQVVPYLIEVLDDVAINVRDQAAFSIGKIGGKTTETLLLDFQQKCQNPKSLKVTQSTLEQVRRVNQYRQSLPREASVKSRNTAVVIHTRKKDPDSCFSKENSEINSSQKVINESSDFKDDLPVKKDLHSAKEWLTLVNDASRCIDNEDFEPASQFLDKAYHMYPQSELLISLMGFTLHKLNRYEEALKIYQYGTAVYPNNEEFWANQGSILANIDQYDAALISFNKALSLCSTDAETWYKKGLILNNISRYQEAVAAFDKALDISPDYAEAKEGKEIARNNFLALS